MSRQWLRILTLWLLGILAAAQFARMSVLAPQIQKTFNLTLSEVGWLISLLEVGGATLGFIAGLLLAVISPRRSLLAGLVVLGLSALVEAITANMGTLFAARGIEGIGYLLVVIAAPTAIAGLADEQLRPRALALWSTFVPVGIAAGAAVTGIILTLAGSRLAILTWIALIMIGIVAAARMRMPPAMRHRMELPAPAAWVSTFGFGIYTVFISGLTMLLPSFLIEQTGTSVGMAALVAALASLSALPTTAIAILWLRRRPLTARSSATIIAISLLATIPFVIALYRLSGAGLGALAALAVLAVGISGTVPPITFARLPQLAGAVGSNDPRIATANGLITQFGAGGALIGPPLAGLTVGWLGWASLGIAGSVVLVAMAIAIGIAESLASNR